MKLSEISPYLIYQFKSDAELVKAISEISHKFTSERSRINDYLNDPRLVSAYTAFYLLTNIPKLSLVLKWMPEEWFEILKQCDFIDLGAGPGTFSLAWKEYANMSGDVYQIEQSQLMKEQGKKIWNAFHANTLFQSTDWNWKTSREKFLLLGHSANEMGSEAVMQYIKKILPEHILFIEPGTKDFFPKMLKIRNALMDSGYQVLFPCPKQEACPMQGQDTDWCHQFIQVKQEAEIERISQMAKLDRKLLPLTVQAFSKTFKVENPSERLVRVFEETKFSFEWEVCHDNKIEFYQVMKRNLSRQQTKEVGLIKAGAPVNTEVVKNLEKSVRVKLKDL